MVTCLAESGEVSTSVKGQSAWMLHISLREPCDWEEGNMAGRGYHRRGLAAVLCPGTMGSLGGEPHGLEASSLKCLLSQLAVLGSISRPELTAWSGIFMKLNPTLSGQNLLAARERCCTESCWGSPGLTMGRWEKTQPCQEKKKKKKTPAASTCCCHVGNPAPAASRPRVWGGMALIQRARPPLPSQPFTGARVCTGAWQV